MRKILKTFVWGVAAVYFVLLGYVPVLAVLQRFDAGLLLWLSLAIVSLILLALVLLRFDKMRFAAFVLSVILLHVGMFYAPNVKAAFDIDYCLDSGGKWQGSKCERRN